MTAERQAEFLAEHKANFNAFKNEPRLLDDWGEFLDLNLRKDFKVLSQYRINSTKPWEFEHIRDLHAYPIKFQMTGAHWQATMQDMFNNGNLKIFSTSDLPLGHPPTTLTTINGHIKYENLYFKRPSGISAGGIEIPPGSGVFYKRKAQQYLINPSWSEQKLKEEMAYAQAYKTIDPTEFIKVASPKFGKSINHVTTFWNSKFSDGTPLGLITSNYGKDPVRNIIVNDHLNLLFIK